MFKIGKTKVGGRYGVTGQWPNLEKAERGVGIPATWNDDAKTFTSDTIGKHRLQIKFNQNGKYISEKDLIQIVTVFHQNGGSDNDLPQFYKETVLPTMHQNIQNNADDSGAASTSNIDAISCNTLPPEKEIQELKITNEAQNKEIEELKQQLAQLSTPSDAIQKPAQASPSLLESVATLSEDEWDVLPSGEAPD